MRIPIEPHKVTMQSKASSSESITKKTASMKFLCLPPSAHRYKGPEFSSNHLGLEEVLDTTSKPFIDRAKLMELLMPCLVFLRFTAFGPQPFGSQPCLRRAIQVS